MLVQLYCSKYAGDPDYQQDIILHHFASSKIVNNNVYRFCLSSVWNLLTTFTNLVTDEEFNRDVRFELRENRQNVTDEPTHLSLRLQELWSGRTGSQLQMNRLSFRNNRVKFKTAGKKPILLEEFIEYTYFNKGIPEDVNM